MFLLVVTALFTARAQSTISFPVTLQHVAPSVIGPGVYAISSLNAENTEYFMTSSLYPNSKKGTKLKGERYAVAADGRVTLDAGNALWQVETLGQDKVALYSYAEQSYLARKADGKLGLTFTQSLSDRAIWTSTVLSNGNVLLSDGERALALDENDSHVNLFDNYSNEYLPHMKNGLKLYKLGAAVSQGNMKMPENGQRYCIASNYTLCLKNGKEHSNTDALLCDGSIAPFEQLAVWTANLQGDSTFVLKNDEGYLDYNLKANASKFVWRLRNGYWQTDEAEPRYVSYADGAWVVSTWAEMQQPALLYDVAEEPGRSVTAAGTCLLTGGWTTSGLKNLDFDGIKCLDVTKAILPKYVKAFTQQQYNCPVFVDEAQAAAVQNVWHFVVLCRGVDCELLDQKLVITDKQPLNTDRAIRIVEGQVSYRRTAGDATAWQTLSLPYDAAVTTGTAYACTGLSGDSLSFEQVKALSAHTGYIIKPSKDGVIEVLSAKGHIDVTSADTQQNLLKANEYDWLVIADDQAACYMLHPTLQNFVPAPSNSRLAPFRAYMRMVQSKVLHIKMR